MPLTCFCGNGWAENCPKCQKKKKKTCWSFQWADCREFDPIPQHTRDTGQARSGICPPSEWWPYQKSPSRSLHCKRALCHCHVWLSEDTLQSLKSWWGNTKLGSSTAGTCEQHMAEGMIHFIRCICLFYFMRQARLPEAKLIVRFQPNYLL